MSIQISRGQTCGKSSKMENINRIYTFFAKRIDKCCCLIMVILAAFIALDLAPVDYCCKLVEQIFTYETGVLVSVILVIWTFTATLVIFYLERMENRHYGNRLIKIILHSYSEHKLYKMVRTFMAELLVLILASIADFEITLVISAIIQFATMLFVFLMVCIETSSDHFQQVMAEEYSAVAYADTMSYKDIENAYKDLMVVKMIRNLDYSNRDSVEELEEILRNNSIKKQSGNVRKYISRRITALILESGGKSQGVKTLILELFADENYDLDDRKGILMALMENALPSNFEICEILLTIKVGKKDGLQGQTMDQDKKELEHLEQNKQLCIWSIMLNCYFETHNSNGWRHSFTKVLFELLQNDLENWMFDIAMKYAKEISNDFEDPDMRWASAATALFCI